MSGESGQPEGRDDYAPREYWTKRLRQDWGLRAVGHASFPERYNRWIYRRKARVLRGALPLASPGDRALDVGSGVGWVVEQLVAAGYRVDGCDISPVAVERLRMSFPDSRISEVRFGEDPLPAEDGTYAVVTILDVSYHVVSDAIWAAGLEEAARVLRPGGLLLVLDRFGPTDDDVAAHVRFRSAPRWAARAREVGLTPGEIRPAYAWLSRSQADPVFARLPIVIRGPLEFGLDQLGIGSPHMRLAAFRKTH